MSSQAWDRPRRGAMPGLRFLICGLMASSSDKKPSLNAFPPAKEQLWVRIGAISLALLRWARSGMATTGADPSIKTKLIAFAIPGALALDSGHV